MRLSDVPGLPPRLYFSFRGQEPGECWLWTGWSQGGYGYTRVGSRTDGTRRQVRVHRLMFEAAKGPIPDGLVIDHLCRNKLCGNPAHLDAVTQRENVLRGDSPAARCAVVTHCPRGHEYTPENTYVCKRGKRSCQTCKGIASKAYQRRKAARHAS